MKKGYECSENYNDPMHHVSLGFIKILVTYIDTIFRLMGVGNEVNNDIN